MTTPEGGARKPRIGIMGEFSAGKSTLSNLLLGQRILPEQVTATRLPPVWIVQGDKPAQRAALDGSLHPMSLVDLEEISLEETLYVKIGIDAPVLDECDLIDFPGISDPNMPSEVWERMLAEVDSVLWCTHATQAWRQSEAAAWGMVPEAVRQRSLLLITRFDKLTTPLDKLRVQTRVARETEGLFAGVCPISLTEALAASPDSPEWEASGAETFADALEAVVRAAACGGLPEAMPAQTQLTAPAAPEPAAPAASAPQPAPGRVMPRRVRPKGETRTPRPSARPQAADQDLSALRREMQES